MFIFKALIIARTCRQPLTVHVNWLKHYYVQPSSALLPRKIDTLSESFQAASEKIHDTAVKVASNGNLCILMSAYILFLLTARAG